MNWRQRYAERKNKVQCGTISGFKAHTKKGEDPCGPCRKAWNKYHREYYRDRKQRALTGESPRERKERLLYGPPAPQTRSKNSIDWRGFAPLGHPDYDETDERHGNRDAYAALGCRCQPCRAAMTEYMAFYRDEKKRRENHPEFMEEPPKPQLAPNSPLHGTVIGFNNYDCRCIPCVNANRELGQN